METTEIKIKIQNHIEELSAENLKIFLKFLEDKTDNLSYIVHDSLINKDVFWTALTIFRKNTAREDIEISDSDFERLRDAFSGRETDWSW